jgi:ubiquitin C-terminal hydrolase
MEVDILPLLAANQGANFHDPLLYELCGVVVHSGSAHSGHYCSYVKDEVTMTGSVAMIRLCRLLIHPYF